MMPVLMAFRAERNQLKIFIRALLTARLLVVPLHHPLPKLLPQLASSKTLQLGV